MRIRAASTSDARRIAEVHVRSWRATYRGLVPDEYLDSLSVDQREAIWTRILQEVSLPSSGVFVIEDEDRVVVGFAAITPSRDADSTPTTGEVGAIYLLPEFWGAGYGWALLDRATESLREAEFSAATLWVLDSNERGRRFYERSGWAPDGAQKAEDRGTFSLHEVRYRRSL
jgi:RimJ/RimL family protein N-acetyltransferase